MKQAAEQPYPAIFFLWVTLFDKLEIPNWEPPAPMLGFGILSLYTGFGLFVRGLSNY